MKITFKGSLGRCFNIRALKLKRVSRREGNKLAHCLAKNSLNVLHCAVWIKDISQFYYVLQADIVGFR